MAIDVPLWLAVLRHVVMPMVLRVCRSRGVCVQLVQVMDSHGRVSREAHVPCIIELMLQATKNETKVRMAPTKPILT
jgi:hypothetical protein